MQKGPEKENQRGEQSSSREGAHDNFTLANELSDQYNGRIMGAFLDSERYQEDEMIDQLETPLQRDIKARIQKEFTPELWVKMRKIDKDAYKLQPENIKLPVIAREFGIRGYLTANHKYHLELGRKIWGSRDIFKYEEKPEYGEFELRAKIREEFLPEEWAAMSEDDKKNYKLQPGNIGLFAIKNKFGVEGNPIENHKYHLELGRKIWGDLDCFKYVEKAEFSDQEVKLKIQSNFTSENWANMSIPEKKAFKLKKGQTEIGLIAIAGIFGVKGNPIGNHRYQLELGQKIWGDLDCFKLEEELTTEQIKEKIKAEYKMGKWLSMGSVDKQKFKLQPEEVTMTGIARRFGIEGDVLNNAKNYRELARRIWE